jgi:hypothetical protein
MDPIAPEEILFQDPCSFTEPLNFLGVDRQTVLDTYYGYLETNINKDFIKACPGLIPFLKSDIALSVFCPNEWQGMRGIAPLDLEVSPLLPKRVYIRARTVKDILLVNAKKEFDRLCKYMYVPSTSQFTSTLYNLHDNTATDIDQFFTAVLNVLVGGPGTSSSNEEEVLFELDTMATPPKLTLSEMFTSVHGGKNFHYGVRRTWLDLNDRYPGHSIPMRVIGDLVSSCPTCQKTNLAMGNSLPSKSLHLKPQYYRKRVGVDTLTLTPVDKNGNGLAIVIVEHFSKFCSIFPCPDHTAEYTAKALFQHFVTYGKFEQVISDPGSDLMSKTVVLLNQWLGQEKLVSLF